MELLKVSGLCKSFGGLAAVKDISFAVHKGQIVSLIGPNGAGKTTVFNLLTGVYTSDAGKVEFEGKNVSNRKPYDYVHIGMVRTFQNVRLYSRLTVLENVLIGAQANINYSVFDMLFNTRKKKETEREEKEKALQLLEEMGLAEYAEVRCDSLAYGQQKKIEIVRAMASNPAMLLFDEPAAGLNNQESDELCDFIRKLVDKGYTVLLIEHDMSLVMKISDYIYVMDHGVMLSEGKPEAVMRDKKVIEAYIGKSGVKNVIGG